MAEKPGVSGKLVVFILFGSALSLWLIVFLIGLREKRLHGEAVTEIADTPDKVRIWLKGLPERWSKVSLVEGQGWVLYVPCYSSNSELVVRTAADSAPGIDCEYCDSLDAYAVKTIARGQSDSVWDFRLAPAAGSLQLLPVNDSLLKAFPEAPFRERIMLWTRPHPGAGADSMVFIPKSQESEFETLRAEDENPEGCSESRDTGGGDPD